MLDNDFELDGGFSDLVDNDDFPTNNSETVPVNVYDLNALPTSFVEELESENQNICMVSDSNIDVYMNLDSTCTNESNIDKVIYEHSELIDIIPNEDTQRDKDMDITSGCNKGVYTDNNNNNIVSNNSEVWANDIAAMTVIHHEHNREIGVPDVSLDTNYNTVFQASDIEINSRTVTDVRISEVMSDNENSSKNVEKQNETVRNESDEMQNSQIRRGRQQVRNPSSWQKEVRKRKRQAGDEYISSRGKLFLKKVIKLTKDCKGKCRRKCGLLFNRDEVDRINRNFWSLTDSQKISYFSQTTEKLEHNSKKADSRRKFTYKYFFLRDSEKVQVCKDFYLSVLQVSDKRIRNFYDKLEKGDGNQYSDMRGKNTKRRTKEEDLNFIRGHIDSFPRIPSHYCRSSTRKEYLEPGLSITGMYDMYVTKCHESHVTPVEKSMYSKILKEEYRIGFHIPKKDRCDLCEEMKNANRDTRIADNDLQQKYNAHEANKAQTKLERDNDRRDKTQVVVCFDLENVIILPKANVSNFFYKRKLSTFNLTAHCSIDGAAYNAIWNEAVCGRGANEIASAIVTILRDIKGKHNAVNSFILWSDSCVPQNRNSIMCYALKRFMIDFNVDTIVQKFCCPGHSSIQEVDNIHSSIEKTLRHAEIYSPVSLVRIMKRTRRRNPFCIIQMQKHNFHDYQKSILGLKFHSIPFTKVKCLKYTKSQPFLVQYKLDFAASEFKQATIVNRITRASGSCQFLPIPSVMKKLPVISSEKKRDLTSMLKYMPEIDQHFYKAMKLV